MRRIVAVMLISLLVTPPAFGGQKPGKPVTWEEAQRLKAGTEVMLTVTGSQPGKVRLLFADDAVLVTLKPRAQKLAGRVEGVLFAIGSKWPGILNRGGSFERDSVRVSGEGVFDGGQKVADLAELIQQTPRGDVLQVSEVYHSHRGRNIGIAIGAVLGVLLAVAAYYGRDPG